MSVHVGQSSGDGYEQEVKVNIVSQSFPDDQKTIGFWGSVPTHWHKVPEPSWQPALLGPLAPGKRSNPCQCRLTATAHGCTLLRCFAMLCLTGPPRWWYKAARWS